VLAGINLASGILEPALAGAVVAAGGLAAAFSAAGAGAAAYGAALKPLLSQTSDVMKAQEALDKARATAQANYAAAIKSGMSVKTADAARTKAMTAAQDKYNIAVKGTPGPVRQFAASVTAAKNTYTKWADSLARPVLGPLSMGLKLVSPALKAITPLVRVTAGAFGMLVTEISRKVSAGGLASVVGTLLPHVRDTILDLGHAAGNVAAGIWGILKAFLPVSGQITGGVVELTARFREWGMTLSSGTGFASLMTTFRTETPQAVAILKNLGVVIGNVGRAMFGLSTFSNSRLLLNLLTPLSGVMASLSKNTDLVRVAMYALLAVKIGQQFSWVTDAWKGLVRFAAAAEGATVAETIAAAATRAWGLAMDALPWVALAAAVVAVAVLIIKYHRQIWAFVQRVWHDVLAVIMGVWGWVKTHWPLLLGIITGPVGLAILWIVRHFGEITTAVKTVLAAVSRAWNAVWGALKAAFRVFIVSGILTPLGWIIHAAAVAFGWIPGLGGKLKTADKAFQNFRDSVNRSLGGINGRTVNVGVHMTSSTNPYPGGISGRRAAGGRITGPGGPRDDRAGLYALSNNEWVIRADSAARYGHAAMAAVNEGRAYIGYAGGGVAVKTGAPGYAAIESSLMGSVTKLARAFAAAASAISAVPVGSIGSGTARWAPLVRQALAMEGLSPGLLARVLYQMQTESGGNPNIFNTTDINAQHGTPSGGLMQVIGPTFRAYHWPGTSWNLLDPLANIAAALNYARHRYGPSLMSGGMGIGSGHGYALGTASAAAGWAWVGERGPELVRFRGGEQVRPVTAGGGTVINNFTITLPPGSDAEQGRRIVSYIRSYESGSGTRWRR
jgi:SLT domain-containing protein